MSELAFYQTIEMLNLQDKLNSVVNVDWRTANNDWPLAILMECTEAIDHYGWKWWKKQEPNMEQLKMELVDIWHFMLSSLIISHEEWDGTMDELAVNIVTDFFNAKYVVPFYNDKNILFHLKELAKSAAKGEINVNKFSKVMSKVGLSWEELCSMYIGKNCLNIFRQANGYKTGGYYKDWSSAKLDTPIERTGLEDNDHLEDILRKFGNGRDTFDKVMCELNSRYSMVVEHNCKACT